MKLISKRNNYMRNKFDNQNGVRVRVMKSNVNIVRGMVLNFMYLIFPVITYILQCYLASQENDKQRLLLNMVDYLKHFLLLLLVSMLQNQMMHYTMFSV
jgi:hypothetical protein